MEISRSARLRAAFPIDECWAEAWEGRIACEACGRRTGFISSVRLDVGGSEARFSLAELGEAGELFDTLCDALMPLIVRYRIARRPSLARGRWCLRRVHALRSVHRRI